MRSIERHLLAWLLGALAFGAVVIAALTYHSTLEEMDEVYSADLKHVAESLGNYHHVGVALSIDQARRLPVRTDQPDPAEIVTITWTHDGQLVYSSDPRVPIPFIARESLSQVSIGAQQWLVYTDVSDNGIAQAAQRLAARQETALESVSAILLPMAGMVIAMGFLMVFVLRRGLRSLDETARDVERRSAASLAPMPADEVPREVLPLVRAINNLLAKLAESMSLQRRFVADAAHELRSPVAALQLQLQLLERSGDEAQRREAIAELESGVVRLRRLVEQLLQVARAEPDGLSDHGAAVDLAEVVRSVVGASSIKAEAHGIDLGAVTGARLVVPGNFHQLTTLLNNLVENSIRYTPAGGVIDVEVLWLEGHPALRVIDSGPGIPTEERERVFDRFYRGRHAAAHEREPGGSGLGLAIVKAIADRHGATVSLHTPVAGRGLEVRVTFAASAS